MEGSLLFVSRPVESESADLQVEFHQLTLTSCHMLITQIERVPRTRERIFPWTSRVCRTISRCFSIATFSRHCPLTQLFPGCYQCLIRSQVDKSNLVSVCRSCGWMNDFGKEGLCRSQIVDLSCTLNGVIVHAIPDP